MFDYYTSISLISWFALITLCCLVYENDRLSKRKKVTYYIIYLLIFLASLSEWIGVYLSGKEEYPAIFLRLAKCCDYVLTPIAGAALIARMKVKNVWSWVLNVIVVFNTVFQIVSIFTGWMISIDEHNVYLHGPLYIIYTIEYLSILLLVVIQFLNYGKNFRKQNRLSLYMVMIFVLLGIFLQEVISSDNRTAYITLTICAALMFIHSSEFTQQKKDDELLEKKIMIKTDALTGLLSRYAYYKAVKKYDNEMPDTLVAFSIDINGLKMVNDTLGHDAGDELICGAAKCIESVFSEYGSCYRTGGDEFIVFANMNEKEVANSVKDIKQMTKDWKGDEVKDLSLSVGYALLADHKDYSCNDLLKEADRKMYKAKDEFYRKSGMNRRKI